MGFLEDYFQELWSAHWLLLMGIFIIAVVLLLPNGIAGFAAQLRRKKGGAP
jgi:ABC-type branched-subunit amino acid transport system permease subunit